MSVIKQQVTIKFDQDSVIKPKPISSSDCVPAQLFGTKAGDTFKCLELRPAENGHYYAKFIDTDDDTIGKSAPLEEGYIWTPHLDRDLIPARARLRKNVNGTFFKKKNIGSKDLSDSEKIYLEAGSELSIKDVGEKVENKHLEVELYQPLEGLINGYIFVGNAEDPGHWDIAGWSHPEPEYVLGNDLASNIVKYMLDKGYKLWDEHNELNIVYVEGMSTNGRLNSDAADHWNDIRTVIEFVKTPQGKKPRFCFGPVRATTEPGRKYTFRALNPNGAFRIKFGQYLEAWEMGYHNWKSNHPALVQVGRLCGYRDLNKDFSRAGDKVFCGTDYGVNQHHGWNLGQVGGASAGCLVGQNVQDHMEFMRILRLDPRYLSNRKFRYSSTIIPGDDLLAKTKA